MEDAGEKQMFRLTPLFRFLPYYLISNSAPYLITHQVLPRNRGYIIRQKAMKSRYSMTMYIYLYHIAYVCAKENFPFL